MNFEMIRNDKNSAPYVLTLTIIDGKTMPDGCLSKETNVRFCVRNRDANQTHPDVVSVPTQRIPLSLADDIIAGVKQVGKQDDTTLMMQESISNVDNSGHHPLIFAVESLLCRKLGVASDLEKLEIEFNAALVGIHEGVARYVNLDEEEQLKMLNVLVVVTKGAFKFPQSSASYDITNWVSVENFLRMWDDGKDVTLAGIDFADALGICVDGLCILSTYDVLMAKIQTPSRFQ